jgi:hypothetical protein
MNLKRMLLLAFAAATSFAATADVCVYVDSYYRGYSHCFSRWEGGHYSLDQIGMNDVISSITIDRDEEVVVCVDSQMRGRCETFTSSVPAVPASLNDKISSIEIRDRRGRDGRDDRDGRDGRGGRDGDIGRGDLACFYEHSYLRGDAFCLSRREAVQGLDRYWNDKVSSAVVPRGLKVIVYQDSYYRGRSLILTPGVYDSLPGFNDMTSSIEVLPYR